jgi:hypothetical protein
LRRQVQSRRIRTAHDGSEPIERWVGQGILFQECVETTELADVRQLDTGYVIRYCARFVGNAQHITRWDIKKFRLSIDKFCNQPRACNAVDLWTFTGNPFHDITSLSLHGRLTGHRRVDHQISPTK